MLPFAQWNILKSHYIFELNAKVVKQAHKNIEKVTKMA